jgi:predicted glycoside hydrolase/deacetylase ChbG (UPF0249 family)
MAAAFSGSAQAKPTSEEKPMKLVVVAADGGYQHSINLGIINGYQKGIITTASLITGGQWFHEIAEFANDNPGLTVGIHLALAGGLAPYPLRPVSPSTEIPSLVDDQGFFFDNYEELEANRKPLYEHIVREFRAQVERAYQEGLDVAYIDNHVALNADSRRALKQVAAEFVLPIKRAHGEVDCDDIYMTPNKEKSAKLVELIDKATVAAGVYLYRCHPGWDTPESRAVTAGNMPYRKGEWALQRQAEADATMAPEVLEVIHKKDIQLIGFYKSVRDELRAKMPEEKRKALLARLAALKSPRDALRGEPWQWTGTSAAIVRTQGAVTLDGDLKEFADAPAIVIDGSNPRRVISRGRSKWEGSTDLSAQVKLMYDEKYLYIAANVTDDTLKNERKPYEVSNGDCLEVFLCSDPDLTYKQRGKVRIRPADRKLTLAPTSREGTAVILSGFAAADEAASEIACVTRPDGYVMEARVPLSALNGTDWKSGDRLRFELGLHDADQSGSVRTKIYWNAESKRGWSNPDLWGVAEIK